MLPKINEFFTNANKTYQSVFGERNPHIKTGKPKPEQTHRRNNNLILGILSLGVLNIHNFANELSTGIEKLSEKFSENPCFYPSSPTASTASSTKDVSDTSSINTSTLTFSEYLQQLPGIKERTEEMNKFTLGDLFANEKDEFATKPAPKSKSERDAEEWGNQVLAFWKLKESNPQAADRVTLSQNIDKGTRKRQEEMASFTLGSLFADDSSLN